MSQAASVTLRESSSADAPLFYEVIARTMREFIVATWGAWDEERVQRESLEESASPNARVILVGQSAAGVLFVEWQRTHVQIQQLYLLPEHQGQGVGTCIINGLVAEASRIGVPVRLRVLIVNPAKRFYEKLGFAVTETTPEFFHMERAP